VRTENTLRLFSKPHRRAARVGHSHGGDAANPPGANWLGDTGRLVVVVVRVTFRDESGVRRGAVQEFGTVLGVQIRGVRLVVPVLSLLDPEPHAMDDGRLRGVAVGLKYRHVTVAAEPPVVRRPPDAGRHYPRTTPLRRGPMFFDHDDKVRLFDVRSHTATDDGVEGRPESSGRDDQQDCDDGPDGHACDHPAKPGHER
jgi:hypothetical protein